MICDHSATKISSLNSLYQILSIFNEIAQGAMKSERCSDEICFADEIKSVPISRRSRISSRSDFIHRRWIYSGRRTDLVEKKPPLSGRQKRFLFCQRVTKGRRIKVKVSKSSVSAPFDKLEFYLFFYM